MIELKIHHTTNYHFRRAVNLLAHRLMLRPRESRDLHLISINVAVTLMRVASISCYAFTAPSERPQTMDQLPFPK